MKKRADGRFVKSKTINGKKVYFYSTAKTEAAARKDFENQLIAYKDKEEKGLTLNNVILEYQKSQKYLKLSPTTQKRYDILLKYILEHFNDVYIKNIKTEHIQDFLNNMVEDDYSTKTIKHQLSMFRIIFKYAKMKKYIANDETQYIVAPDGQKEKKRRALTEEEVNIIENNINTEFGLFAYFVLNTGVRRGEALAIKYSDLDFENKILHITKSAYYIGNQPQIKAPKTENGIRDIILPDRLIKVLKKGNSDEYVFSYPNNPKKLMTADVYERLWRNYIKAVNLKDITAHMLRHTYATILFEADINVKDAQRLMGHADITTTNNIYIHIREPRIKATAEKLNKHFESCQKVVKD